MKSIRLNKSHREDIINAVMKNWDEQNLPETDIRYEFLKEFIISIRDTERMKKLKKLQDEANSLSHELKKCLMIRGNYTASILFGEDTYAAENFVVPVEIADEIGLPYIDKDTMNCNREDIISTKWFDKYLEENPDQVRSCGRAEILVAKFPRDLSVLGQFSNTLPAYKAYQKKIREHRKTLGLRKQVMAEFRDMLDQFNTTKQIREGWPELVDYLPAHLADPDKVIQLPAITRSRLNERLGIQ